MQTHPDGDAAQGRRLRELFGADSDPRAEKLAALEQRAREMVANGESEITAGRPGEESLGDLSTPHGHVRRLPDDTLALRISIGEGRGIPDSRYIVFRGDPGECLELLERAVLGLRQFVRTVTP